MKTEGESLFEVNRWERLLEGGVLGEINEVLLTHNMMMAIGRDKEGNVWPELIESDELEDLKRDVSQKR